MASKWTVWKIRQDGATWVVFGVREGWSWVAARRMTKEACQTFRRDALVIEHRMGPVVIPAEATRLEVK